MAEVNEPHKRRSALHLWAAAHGAVGSDDIEAAPSAYNVDVLQPEGYALIVWTVILLDEVDAWYGELVKEDQATAEQLTAAIDKLEADGSSLGRPLVDRIKGSKIHALKELRPGSGGGSEVRILFVFDPQRQAVLLVAGDKSGQWRQWYTDNIPVAEQRYERWLAGDYDEEI